MRSMELVRMLMVWGERCRVEVTDCGACGAGAAQQDIRWGHN